MQVTMINETTNHKNVGLIFSNNCSWTDHFNSTCDQAWARLNLMRILKFRVSRRSLENRDIAYVHPLIEYSDSVWAKCSTESKKNHIESIHMEAARVITGATNLCSIEKRFASLGLDSLQKRHYKHKLVILYKILHGIAPTYLSDIAPPLIQGVERQQGSVIDTIKYHTCPGYHMGKLQSHNKHQIRDKSQPFPFRWQL